MGTSVLTWHLGPDGINRNETSLSSCFRRYGRMLLRRGSNEGLRGRWLCDNAYFKDPEEEVHVSNIDSNCCLRIIDEDHKCDFRMPKHADYKGQEIAKYVVDEDVFTCKTENRDEPWVKKDKYLSIGKYFDQDKSDPVGLLGKYVQCHSVCLDYLELPIG